MVRPKEQGGLAFKDIQSVNEAYLAKLSWRIINNPNGLLGRTLIGKYCPSESFLTCPGKNAISHDWRGILVGRDIILKNAGWEVGNGQSINIWEKDWLDCKQQLRPMGPAPEDLQNLTLSDLFIPNTFEWDVEKIRQVLPFEEQRIRSLKPSLTGAPDKLIWLNTISGEFTTKSGYAVALSSRDTIMNQPQLQNFDWRKNVWKLQTMPKIKLFVWKTFNDALPVGDTLLARHMPVDGNCKRCNLPKSTDHLFLHCEFAQQVWNSAPVFPAIEISGALDLELKHLWTNLCSRTSLPPTGVALGSLAPWILWQLWTARNQLVFNNRIITVEETISKAIASACEWGRCQNITTQAKKLNPQVLPSHPPEVSLIRSDAAWNESLNVAGLGWSIAEYNRTSTFSTPAHFVSSPLAAEGLAIREAMLKSRELGLSKIRCESDSSILVNAINNGSSLAGLHGILADITSFASSFDVISFNWISRERNTVADSLAKQCLDVELAIMASPNFG